MRCVLYPAMAEKPRKVLEEKWIGQPPLRYGSFCIETYPCQHAVEINGTVEAELWTGQQIVQWFRDNNVEIPKHFGYLMRPSNRPQ